MKKLGIAIKSTLMGSGEPYKINPGPWDSKIVDIRNFLRFVPSLATDPQRSIIFFSFSENGCYITIAHCYPNRVGDNIAGWIFVPSEIQISGEEIVKAVEDLRHIIYMSELPDKSVLEQQFSKEYPEKPGPTPYKPSPKNGVFAKRDLTPATPLPLLLGDGRYQSYYADYQAIFIETVPNEVVGVADLTSKPLAQLILVYPPTAEQLRKLGPGVEITLTATGEPFKRAKRLPKGTVLPLCATRRGFAPVKFTYTAETDGAPISLPNIKWEKKITPQDFIIYDQIGSRVSSGFQILLNGQPLNGHRFMQDHELGRVRVTVRLNGQERSVEADLHHLPLEISFGAKGARINSGGIGGGLGQEGSSWKVRLNDGQTADVTIKGRNISRHNSPLKGYEAEGGWLTYKGGNAWGQRLIGFLSAIILGGVAVGILAICGVFSGSKEAPKGEAGKSGYETPAGPFADTGEAADPKGTLEAAIQYLNENKKWTRSEMESYAYLKGLYDDLNSFNFPKITGEWSDKLKKSKSFSEVVDNSAVCAKQGWNAKSKTAGGTFNEPGDEVIIVQNYNYWVNKRCATEGSSSSTAKPKERTIKDAANKSTGKPKPASPTPSTQKPENNKPPKRE